MPSQMKVFYSSAYFLVISLALNNAQIPPETKCAENQHNLARLGLCPGSQIGEEFPCSDLCTREYIMGRVACAFAAHCCVKGGKCVLRQLAKPIETQIDINEVSRSFLPNRGGHTGARLHTIGRPSLSIAEIQTLHPHVSILPKFPDSCELSYSSPEDLEPPVNVPYCQRIACRPNDILLEFNPMQCLSVPGCAFDNALFTYRNAISQIVLFGVPVCHLAIRNKAFQRLSIEYIRQSGGPWNPLLTNCFINQHQKEIYAETPGCSMTRILGELGRQAKHAGWRGITRESCHLIDGCWINNVCVYALPLHNIKTISTKKRGSNVISRFGRHACLPFSNNLTNGEFLNAYHSCLASGCSLDVDRETVMRHIYGVSTTYLPPHLQPQYWTMALLGQVQAHNWKEVADRLIEDNIGSPYSFLGNISPRNVLSGSPITQSGVFLLPFTLRVNSSMSSSLLNSFTTYGSFGQFGSANTSQNILHQANRPIRAGRLNLEHFGSLNPLYSPGSASWKYLQQLLSGEGPPPSNPNSSVELPCPYEFIQWPDFPPLKGSFQDCCEKTFCYIPRRDIRNVHSEIASYQTDWTTWGPCSRTCGVGQQIRRRFCIGDGCEQVEEETQLCSLPICPPSNGQVFSQWSQYSSCSATCGGGRKRRTRTCLGHRRCRGRLFQSVPCETGRCPAFRQTSWSPCSTSCGTGLQQRSRTCVQRMGFICPLNSDTVEERACERYCGKVIYTNSPCNAVTCVITRTPRCITRDGGQGHCPAAKMQVTSQRCPPGHCRCIHNPTHRSCRRNVRQ